MTLTLPEPLYERLRERAVQTQRSVEEEILEALATAVPINASLPVDMSFPEPLVRASGASKRCLPSRLRD